jgi:hypothetical protein
MRQERTKSSVTENVKWGLWYGVFMGCFYSAFGLLILVSRGSAPFANRGISFGTTIAAYMVGGTLGGCILGLLRPITRYVLGAMLAAIPVSLPLFAGLLVAMSGSPTEWDENTWITLVGLTCVIAPFFGFLTWYRNKARR